MNQSNEIIGGSLLIITICITLLVRYALVWYADIRNIRIRLTKVEEDFSLCYKIIRWCYVPGLLTSER